MKRPSGLGTLLFKADAANSALLSDALGLRLRRPHGAAKRGR
jgi:hypothetical protein